MRYHRSASLALILSLGWSVAALAAASTLHSGHAADAMNTAATANSNGPAASDRDKGADRAADRRSAKGAAQKTAQHKHHKSPATNHG
jgi:hypothetical protein